MGRREVLVCILTTSFYTEAHKRTKPLTHAFTHAHAHSAKACIPTHTHTQHINTYTHTLCDSTNKVGITASVARIPVLLAPT